MYRVLQRYLSSLKNKSMEYLLVALVRLPRCPTGWEGKNYDFFPSEPNHDNVIEPINLSISNVVEILTDSFDSIKEIDNNGDLSSSQDRLKEIKNHSAKFSTR